ncbi:hypothetical protein ACIBMX_10450 [Streptomyces phaeochromogenes]|uniref:hypothetical protein n=1 Tax=Streptomyces phaeochromogenes TaxID=1923 RepID=UPI0033FAD55E
MANLEQSSTYGCAPQRKVLLNKRRVSVTDNHGRELDEILSISHDDISEVTYIVESTGLKFYSGINILERLRGIPGELIVELTTRLRNEPWDPIAKDCWADHYSQKDPNGWRDSFKNGCGSEVPHDRIPGGVKDRPGPSFYRGTPRLSSEGIE